MVNEVFQELQKYQLCRSCSRRQGFREASAVDSKDCLICRGLSDRLDEIGSNVLRQLAGYEFRTFSLGLSLPEGMQEREDSLRAEYKLKGRETVKAWVSRGLSDRIAKAARRRVDKLHPDLVILIDLDASEIRPSARPLFIYGRYTKPGGIYQRRTRCPSCGGRGCEVCHYSGYQDEVSVESAIVNRLGDELGSHKMKFTWIGTEDIESAVKPPGRPFVVEVKNPKKRRVSRNFVSKTGKGQIRVSALKLLPSRPSKTPSFRFKTRAEIDSARKVSLEELARLSKQMRNVVVEFRRPGDRPAYKKVYSVKARVVRGGIFAEIDLDGGLPVKRFVNGDSVSPSISEVLKTELKCRRFDILRVRVGKFQFG